jgi:small subunit ribosomal protein S6
MYELVYILPSDLDSEKREKANKDVIKTISSRNGALVKDDYIGERLLQYPIKRYSRGHYFLIEFTIPVDHLESLKKDLNLKENVLRYLITKKEIKPQPEEKAAPEKKEKTKENSKNKQYTIVKSKDEVEGPKKVEKATLAELDKKLDEILE